MVEANIRNTFSKAEKLCEKRAVELLFNKGVTVVIPPLRATFLETGSGKFRYPRILIAVPKKNYKLAVVRNRIKRLIREAYRLRKHHLVQFLEVNQMSVDIAIIFTKSEKVDLTICLDAIDRVISKIIKALQHQSRGAGKVDGWS
jgi:ribonuclease P protein component